MLAFDVQSPARAIVQRTRGHTRGPITRLMSPSDLGQLVKPFVFLDLAVFDAQSTPMRLEDGWHPHSGIATVTVMLEGAVRFAETTGKRGVLPAGSVEWMRAGNGVWHTGATDLGSARAFQLWVALPPDLENAASASHYVMPEEVPVEGPARVILGSYGQAKSPIAAPPMNYLAVRLEAGERWTYRPPAGHTLAWLAVSEGAIRAPALVSAGEMAIFEESERAIDFVADADTRFVLGSAPPHEHELVLGSYSVHTSLEALRRGQAEIRRIGQELRAEGILGR